MDYAVPFTTKKTATNFGMRLFNDTYQLLFPLKLQISNATVVILRIHEYYVRTTTFTLILQNGLLVLVVPIFQTDRRNVQRRTECLLDVFLHVFAEKRWHILHNFIDEVHRRAAINPFLLSTSHNKPLQNTEFLKSSKREG